MNKEENEDSEGEDNDGMGEGGGLVMTILGMIGRIPFESCTWSRKGTVTFSAIVV